ncbi:MAG: ABC transporter ATP-binding protein [Pseudomonadales bacterium]
MKLLLQFVRQYPAQSLLLVVILLVAGTADGIGFSMLVPILNLAVAGETGAGETGVAGVSGSSTDGVEGFVVNLLESTGLPVSLGLLLALMVCAIATKSILIFIAELRIGYVAADITTSLRTRLLRAIAATRWDYYIEQPPGRLSNALSTEAVRASNAFIFGVRFLSIAVEVTVYSVLALLVSWQATLTCIGAAAVVFVIANQFVSISRRAGARQTDLNRSLLSSLGDVLQSVKAIKAMGRAGATEAMLANDTQGLRKALKHEALGKAALLSAPETMYMLILAIGIYAALVVFSFEVAAVLFLVVILSRMMRRLGKLQRNFQHMATCETAYWSIVDAIEQAEQKREIASGTRTPALQHHIVLENVDLSFNNQAVLRNLTMTIPRGFLTCLIGPSGSGKSSIADLILGFTEPSAGAISVDDIALSQLDRQAWRQRIGYVSQDNVLLNESIFNNVSVGLDAISDADVEHALVAAGAMDFVRQLEGGMHASVGERGSRLSGGQRQRILIARAIVHQPDLLILDEATSALDQVTEQAIAQTLASLKGQMTILSISHRSSTVESADIVYQLDAGGVQQTKGLAVAGPDISSAEQRANQL